MNLTDDFKELQCDLVSTYGLALSCDYPPSYFPGREIRYKTEPSLFRKGSLVYIHPRHFREFITQYWPRVKEPIALMINNDDDSFPFDYGPMVYQLLKSDKLICVFAQNCLAQSNKIFPLPIGIDYHTMMWEKSEAFEWGPGNKSALVQELDLLDVKSKLLPIQECKAVVATNFQHSMESPMRRKTFRQPIYEATKDATWINWLPKQTRTEFWLSLKDTAFVMSPPGNGIDTHRTWETLMLGRIPIVSKCPLNKVFEGLPVWEVSDWSAFATLSAEDLQKKLNEFVQEWSSYRWEKLTLKWWQQYIRSCIAANLVL